MAFTKINAAGIGSTELVTLHSLEVLNNATVGGVLTYEDVTNVDSVGLITARNGIVVGSGITLSKDGDIFATGVCTASSFSGPATQVTVAANNDNTTYRVPFTSADTGNVSLYSDTSNGVTYNPSTGTLSATSFSGGLPITNGADNRVITASSASAIQGESSLTYNGTLLYAQGSNEADLFQLSSGNGSSDTFVSIRGDNRSGIRIRGGGSERGGEIDLGAGQRASDPAVIKFSTTTGTSFSERARITADGQFRIVDASQGLRMGIDAANYKISRDNSGGDAGHLKFYANQSGYTGYIFTGVDGERLRIGSGGDVSLRRGGITATPSLEIYGSGNHSDTEADNLRFHNWGNSDGDYWQIGVNSTLDANGNNAKPSTTLKGAAVRINGKNGSVTLITSPSSTSTQYEGLTQNQYGHVSIPQQPAFAVGMSASRTASQGWQVINFDQEKFDNGGNFDTSSNRFTAPEDGYYQFNLNLRIDGGGGSGNYYRIVFRKNNSTGGQYDFGHAIYRDDDGFAFVSMSISAIIQMSSTDYVDAAFYAHSTSGVTTYMQRESLFSGCKLA